MTEPLPFEQFLELRDYDDIDLVPIIKDYMLQLNVDSILINRFNNDPNMQLASSRRSDVQRYLINKFLLETLMTFRATHDITNLRLILSNNDSINDWLIAIREVVLVFISDNYPPIQDTYNGG